MNEYLPSEQTNMAKVGAYYDDSMVAKTNRNPPVRKIVEARIKEFETLIEQHKALLVALDASPGTEAVLDSLRKLGL